jgi:hypothetical protein
LIAHFFRSKENHRERKWILSTLYFSLAARKRCRMGGH